MSLTSQQNLVVKKTEKSRINEVDFNNLSFGQVFTDHMFECDIKMVLGTIQLYDLTALY